MHVSQCTARDKECRYSFHVWLISFNFLSLFTCFILQWLIVFRSDTISMCIVVIRLEARLRPNVETLLHVSTGFTHSAITVPEVNRFGWNLGHSEHTVCRWLWQILGRDLRRSDSETVRWIFFFSGKQRAIFRTSHRPYFTKFAHKTWSVRWWILRNRILKISHKRSFLQRAACSHCKRCTGYGNSVSLSVRLSHRYCVKMTARSTVQFALSDSKMCLVL